jgi:hypothetical protein
MDRLTNILHLSIHLRLRSSWPLACGQSITPCMRSGNSEGRPKGYENTCVYFSSPCLPSAVGDHEVFDLSIQGLGGLWRNRPTLTTLQAMTWSTLVFVAHSVYRTRLSSASWKYRDPGATRMTRTALPFSRTGSMRRRGACCAGRTRAAMIPIMFSTSPRTRRWLVRVCRGVCKLGSRPEGLSGSVQMSATWMPATGNSDEQQCDAMGTVPALRRSVPVQCLRY